MPKPKGPLQPGQAQGYQKTPEEPSIDEAAFPSVPTDIEPEDTKGLTPYQQLPQNRFAQFQPSFTVTPNQYQELQLKPNEYQQLQLKPKEAPEIKIQIVKKPPSEISRKDREKNAHSMKTVLNALSKEALNMLINAMNTQNRIDPNKSKKAKMDPEKITVTFDAKSNKYMITDGIQGIRLDPKQMTQAFKLAVHSLKPEERKLAMTLSGGPRSLPRSLPPPPAPVPPGVKVAPLDPSKLPPPPPPLAKKGPHT